ncbi:MAG: family 10 glycosylhydrolase [Candidatus Omnitrophota bacterium]
MKKCGLVYILCLLFLFSPIARCEGALAGSGLFVMALDEPQALSSRREISKLVNLAKRIRARVIFIQIYRGNRSWFASKIADPAPYNACLENVSEDPLGLLIKQAHSLGIEVHAWLNILSLSRNKNAPILRKYGFSVLTRDLKEKKGPEDYRIDGQYFLEPGDIRVRGELSGIVEEVVRAYPDLDGIQLDYVRYPDKNPAYGYTAMNMERFRKATGAKHIEEDSHVWQDWKSAQVTAMLERLVQAARRIRPNIRISVTGCMPIQRACSEAFQDWPSWLNRKLVDFVTVMDYSPEPSEFKRWISAIKDKVDDFRKVKIGIGAYKLGNLPEEFKEELRFSEKLEAGGYVIFHYSSLTENPALVNILEEENASSVIP